MSHKEILEIPGVGEELAAKIEEYLRTGAVSSYEKLKGEVPAGLAVAAITDLASAERLLADLAQNHAPAPDFVISGVPLATLERPQTLALLAAVHNVLAQGGLYIQFQYSLVDRSKIRARFSSLRTLPVWLNFPPAVIYYARR